MSGNFTPRSEMRAGGWVRDGQMKPDCISLGMFSRRLWIIWGRFQSAATDECKSSLFLWSRWLLILVMLKIKHLNGNSTYGAAQSQTTLLLAVFQRPDGKIIIKMHAVGHRLNICLYEHKLALILFFLCLFSTNSSVFVHSFSKIYRSPPVRPRRWYNSGQGHACMDFIVCWGSLCFRYLLRTYSMWLGKRWYYELFKF